MKENVPLAEFTTMKTGGSARFFFLVKNTDELRIAVIFAKENNLHFFVLGAGSNTIVADEGFNGVVIKIEIEGFAIDKHNENTIRVIVGAGVNWDDFVKASVKNNLYGIENLSAIPGTVGAAPVQNIGAYGAEVSDTIAWVDVFDTQSLENYTIGKEQCFFGYRDSIFKTKKGKECIITHVAFDLKKRGVLNINYQDVLYYFRESKEEVTLKSLRSAIVKIRNSKLPDVNEVYSSGSFFKNPVINIKKAKNLEEKYPGLKYFSVDNDNVKISAGWILDHICNVKNFKIGNASVYDKHALVLVNNKGKKTKDILFLAEKIFKEVKSKTGIELEREVNLLGL